MYTGADGGFSFRDATFAFNDAGIGWNVDASHPVQYTEDTNYGVRFADWVLLNWDTGPRGFDYYNGIVLRGLSRMYERTGDPRYLSFVAAFADRHIGPDGTNLDLGGGHDIDAIMPAIIFNFLYRTTGEARYLTAAHRVRTLYDTIPRNADGGFWHKSYYPNEMWADTAYMGMPFLADYSRITDCGDFCGDTITAQTLLFARHAQLASGLVRHGWDQDRNASWADPDTGLASIVWSRGVGWYAMALVDSLDGLDTTHPDRPEMIATLQRLAEGARQTQDPVTGLWFHVVDQGERPDNWVETSGSLFLIYVLKKSVELGYLDRETFLPVALRGWEAIVTRIDAASTPGIPIIDGAVIGTNIQNRYEDYIARPTEANGAHALLGIMSAASVFERY